MDLPTTLDIPDAVLAGLLRGDLVRRGGVIQRASGAPHAGEIVMWLRETGTTPVAPNSLLPVVGSVGHVLGLAGSVASIINLGATVAFGVALYSKLHDVAKELEALRDKLDGLQWTIELGFITVLQSVARLSLRDEIGMKAKVQSAATLAWTARPFEPQSPQRVQRLENAYTLATEAYAQLHNLYQHEMESAIEFMKKRSPQDRMAIQEDILGALRRFRQTCLACSLRAAIQAETGNPGDTATSLERDQAELYSQLRRLGQAFLQGSDPESTRENSVYRELIDSAWKRDISACRLAMWAQRFDSAGGGLTGVLDLTRPERKEELCEPLEDIPFCPDVSWPKYLGSSAKTLFTDSLEKHRQKLVDAYDRRISERKNLPPFANLLDGAYEDVDRLAGYVCEYRTAGKQRISIQTYRERLAVQELPKNSGLVFLLPKSAL